MLFRYELDIKNKTILIKSWYQNGENTSYLSNLEKPEDFEHFLILPPQKIVPYKSCFCLNMSVDFLLHGVLFALYYSNLQMYCHCI